MKSGTQAIDGMARRAWSVGSRRRRIVSTAPESAADHDAGGRPDAEAREHAPQRRPDMGPEFAGAGEGLEGRVDPARRRHEAALGEAGADRNLPGEGNEDRQQEAEKHARIDSGALPGKGRRTESGGFLGGGGQDFDSSRRAPVAPACQRDAVENRRSTSASTAAFTSTLAGMTPAS